MNGLRERLTSSLDKSTTQGSFVRATAILVGGTAAGQLITVLASPIVSRLYGPAAIATLGSFATVLSCIAPIVCLRYEGALSLPEEETEARRLLFGALGSALCVALATIIFVALGGGWLGAVTKDPDLRKYLWLLPISVFGVGVYQAFSYWAIRQRGFALAAGTKVIQGVLQAGCQIGLGLLKAGGLGLVIGDVVGRVAGGGSIALKAWREKQVSFKRIDIEGTWDTLRRFRSFPLVSGPATLLHTATTNYTFLIAVIYGSSTWGQYYFGIRFVWAPVALLGQGMAQVFLGEASRWAREDPEKMLRAFDQIVKRLAVIGLVPFGALALAGGPLTALVFGETWREAGVLVQIQAVSWWVMFVVGPVLNTLNILQRQGWQLLADAVIVAAMAVGFWLSWSLKWSAAVSVAVYSGAIVVLYVWLYVACRRSIVLAAATRRP
ncbi:MAG: oligosaccharide flippase family protein [Armatimonadetes bacterium]|nr:oligosaccharide flippase family protein [Armatimonadota bacterium]